MTRPALDPVDATVSAPADRCSPRPTSDTVALPPSLDGADDSDGVEWGGWGATRSSRASREWADGWDRRERCPPDPKGDASPGRRGWRDVDGLAASRVWAELHGKRRQVVRALRRSGYGARHRWARRLEDQPRRVGPHEVDDWRYLEGPAVGRQAVDPWAVAGKLQLCSSSWYVQLRAGVVGLVPPMAVPRPCGLWHVCPVCAARRSAELAAGLRDVVTAELKDHHVALVTLTQRARVGETLAGALERWRRAWGLMVRGRRGRRWSELVAGYYYGLEVTRNTDAHWWHLHAHVVVVLEKGLDPEAARAWVGQAWRESTESAGPGLGWQPEAGDCTLGPAPVAVNLPRTVRWLNPEAESLEDLNVAQLRAIARHLPIPVAGAWKLRRAALLEAIRSRALEWDTLRHDHRPVTSWDGGWWEEVDTSDPARVYQACKYPTPITQLGGLHLAEFLAVSHGRRWHQGGGVLRGVVVDDSERPEADDSALEEVLRDCDITLPERVEPGRNVGSCAPGEAPALDDVAPGLGWMDDVSAGVVDNPDDPWVSWRLALGDDPEPPAALVEAILEVGGRVHHAGLERWAWLPRKWVRSQLARRHAAAKPRRIAMELVRARRRERLEQLEAQRAGVR